MAHITTDLAGFGVQFQVMISASYVSIPELHELSWPGLKVGVRNPNTLTVGHVRKKPGIPDFGQIKGKFWYDPNDATHQAIVAKMTAATPNQAQDQVQIIYPDGFTTPAHAVALGFFSESEEEGYDPEKGTIARSFTFEVDNVTLTAGAPTT